jgi:hypothetical protein
LFETDGVNILVKETFEWVMNMGVKQTAHRIIPNNNLYRVFAIGQ